MFEVFANFLKIFPITKATIFLRGGKTHEENQLRD